MRNGSFRTCFPHGEGDRGEGERERCGDCDDAVPEPGSYCP